MSFLFVEPQLMASFAADLQAIGSALSAANSAASAQIGGMAAAAADEVSVQIAALFSQNAVGYQEASAQAAAYYNQFVGALNAGSNAYVAAESAAAQVVGSAASVETALQLALSGNFSGLAAQLNAGLSGLGAQVNTALSGNLGLEGLAAQLGLGLNGNFQGGLPSLAGFVQTGQSLAANLNSAVSGGLSGLSGLSGGFGASLPALAGQFSAALTGLGGGFAANLPSLGGNLGGGFAGNLAGALPALAARLNTALTGGLSGGLPDLSALAQTGATLGSNLNAALNGLGGSFTADLPVLTELTGALGADLSGLGGRIDAALGGAFSGDFDGVSALVDATAGLPTITLDAAGQTQVDLLTGFVDGQVKFNENLVANQIALQQAIFGAELNPAVTAGFNAFNVLVGTGEQTINALLGAPMPADFMGSLMIGGDIEGGVPTGGLIGVLDQALAFNAAIGGPAIDGSFLTQLELTGANLVADQLAFNAAAVANVLGLQQSLFGTTSAFNGVINNAFNMVGGVVVSGQQVFNTLLGFPMPADFGTSLLVSGSGDVFGGVATGGLLGALENKWLMDLAFLSNLGFPVQVILNGGLPGVLADLNAALTGNVVVEAELGD